MNSPLRRIGFVVAICALAGALAGIAGSAAAPSAKKSSKSQKAQAVRHAKRFGMLRFGARPFGPNGGPVHSETVIPNAAGDGFVTVTMDSGKLKSLDGTKLTLTEGTDKATYGTPTIDVGSDAKVFRNGEKATLSDLKEGDHVHIIQGGPKGNVVFAEDDAFLAQMRQMKKRFFRHHFGPDGPKWGPGAPPPPPPPGDGSYPGDESGSGSSGSNS